MMSMSPTGHSRRGKLMRFSKCTTVWLPLLWCCFLGTGLGQEPTFEKISILNSPTIAGRPVNLDEKGKLLPWPMPNDTGYSYSSYALSQWTILWDQHNRQKLPYLYCCFDFDRTTFELQPDPHWANSTAYLRAMMEGFVERLYPYTGDEQTMIFLQSFVDYELEHGLTPEGYVWAQVPYASANPGAPHYSGWSNLGEDFVEPPIVGEDGYAYLKLYEMTGNTKYLRAAIRCAEALVKNWKPGDAEHSPWPVRCYARDGKDSGGGNGPYSANVIEPIMLFDELIRLNQGNVAEYQRVRGAVWEWFKTYPLANNVWVGYFEDTVASMGNMNQVIPLEFARYVLLHPDKDPEWREHARKLIEWVKNTPKWPKYIVHGATVTTEQGNGIRYCCNDPGQCCDSHTSRLAAVEALYYAKTGETAYREDAYRSFNWVTYFQGLSSAAHSPFAGQWWFTDQYADGPRRMMDSFWAVPEWAPADESHLLGSSSVVTKIHYSKGGVTYSTFDAASDDVLRLDFVPDFVTADGRPMERRKDLSAPGYTFDDTTHVMRIRHDAARAVDIQGHDGAPTVRTVTFDDPHELAGAVLKGEYPAGAMLWGESQWAIHVPAGGFATFNLAFADSNARTAEFRFYWPRVFVGMDVYNSGSSEATITLSCPEMREVKFTVKPGELRRLRTNWPDPSSKVIFTVTNGEGLLFDNMMYRVD
jgi:hypothetical protein